jgi:hypothetical protein
MHKLYFHLFVVLFAPVAASSQYYQKDVLGAKQAAEQIKQFKTHKIRKVVLQSFEATGEPVEQFICFQEIAPAFNVIKTYTQTPATMQSVLVSQFNGKGQLLRSADSSNTTLNVSNYSYDAAGRLTFVENVSQAYAYKTKETVRHEYKYDSTGFPVSMLRIKNGNDTSYVQFKSDEKGNVGEEVLTIRGKETETWYYYYDEQNRLTDVVRYNTRAKRLLPDYLYEYNEQSLLTQMISVQSGSSDYITWRYQYNAQGLKTKESCFSKQKQLMGYVTYRYE